ncbi:MAG: ribosome biogenesis GTP-binding protein YihA/YsxC [Verrucomicrobiota bacterium]
MSKHAATFITSATDLAGCPDSSLYEFALVGRSNVGKSSLINMLTKSKDLAKTSGVPGKTRLINYFLIQNRWHLVDLPGYGYAQISKSAREKFNVEVSDYLVNREQLKHVFCLVDSQHPPMESDLSFMAWMEEYQISYSAVLTKVDRVKANALKTRRENFIAAFEEYQLHPAKVFTTSAKSGTGSGPLFDFIQSKLPKAKKEKKSKRAKSPHVNFDWMKKK